MIELSSCPEWQDILVVSVIIFIYLLFLGLTKCKLLIQLAFFDAH